MSAGNSDSVYQLAPPGCGSERPSWAPSLSKEALFRIQLSLSSRRSSVMVLETVCRIFIGKVTQKAPSLKLEDLDPSDTTWTYQTTGVPGLLVEYADITNMKIFSLKLVIIELESGLCTWEGKFGVSANYQVFAEDFHSFWLPEVGQVGIEFGDTAEGERMRVLLREWLERLKASFALLSQQEREGASRKKSGKKKSSYIQRTESQLRLEKKQISSPCNFIHVSGITMTRTEECEKELQGTVRRFFRGAVASLTRTNTVTASPSPKTRSTLREQGRLSASSLGDLSGREANPSLRYDSPDSPKFIKRCSSSQSTKDRKFHSLQRKKKDKRSNSPSESDTSESTRDNQSQVSVTLSAAPSDNVTPNSRRKGIVTSRVITSDDYFSEQDSQRRSTVTAPPDRKLSMPNIRSSWDQPGVLRQHSHIPNSHSEYQTERLNGTDQSTQRHRFSSEASLPAYRPPPVSTHPSLNPSYSLPPSNHSVSNRANFPPQGSGQYFPPPISSNFLPNFAPQDPSQFSSCEAPLRTPRPSNTRTPRKSDQRPLSNSYTSFGHVGSSQVDV